MYLILKILLGIGVAVLGGRLGLRRISLMIIGAVAMFCAYSLVKCYFEPISSAFEEHTYREISVIFTLLLLVVPPVMLLYYLGRNVMVKLSIVHDINPVTDQLLGSALALTVYIAILLIL
jgi:hypothetical protein